jgi:hypothetical protein
MDLARVFADVPRVGAVKGCTYCYRQADLDLLGGDPAQVPDYLVGTFAAEVPDHWSEEQYGLLWRGLAPRILGLLERAPDEMLLRGLAFARFDTWPAEEQTAVREAVRAMVAGAVTTGAPGDVVAQLVRAAANLDQDVMPWLRYLDTLPGAGVAGLARHWARNLGTGGETLWWLPEDQTDAIRDWLYSDALHERLHRVDDRETQIAIAEM